MVGLAELLCLFVMNRLSTLVFPGRSVVWLARLLWEQEAVSSNLTVPTILPFQALKSLLVLN
jgi:hypothetical protein